MRWFPLRAFLSYDQSTRTWQHDGDGDEDGLPECDTASHRSSTRQADAPAPEIPLLALAKAMQVVRQLRPSSPEGFKRLLDLCKTWTEELTFLVKVRSTEEPKLHGGEHRPIFD